MAVSRGGMWKVLGIPATRDRTLIRRAYAGRLRVTNPEDDAEGFQALRAAYEQALAWAGRAGRDPPHAAVTEQPSAATEPTPDAPDAIDPEDAVTGQVSHAEIQALQEELSLLAQTIHGEAPDPEAALVAFERLMVSPAMDSVAVRDQVERHVASMILSNGSLAFARLVDTASSAFGWTSNRLGVRSELAAAVEARRDDAAFLATVRRKASGLREAYLALARPPTIAARLRYRISLGLPRRVGQLLEEFDRRHASLRDELNPDAVNWWRSYLERPTFGAGFVWTTLLLPPLIAAIAAEGRVYNLTGRAAFFAAWAAILGAFVAGGAVWVLGLARARAHWWTRRAFRAPLLERVGWAPLVLVNLLAAAAIPAEPSLAWLFVPLAVVGVVWAIVTADRATGQPVEMVWTLPTAWLPMFRIPVRLPRWLVLALGFLAIGIFWFGLKEEAPPGAWARLQFPVTAAAVAFAAGHDVLETAWHGLAVRARIAGLSAFVVAVAGLPFWLWATSPAALYVPVAGACVTIMVMLERIVVLGDPRRGLRDNLYYWGWLPAVAFGAIVQDEARHGNAMLLFLSLWLLSGAVVGVLGALRRECQSLPMPKAEQTRRRAA